MRARDVDTDNVLAAQIDRPLEKGRMPLSVFRALEQTLDETERLSWFVQELTDPRRLAEVHAQSLNDAIVGMFWGGFGGTIRGSVELGVKASQAKARANALLNIHDKLSVTKIKKYSPEMTKSMLEDLSPDLSRTAMIPADQAIALYQDGTDIITPLGISEEDARIAANLGQSLDVPLSDMLVKLDRAQMEAAAHIMSVDERGMSVADAEETDARLEEDAAEVTRIYNEYAKEQSEYDAERDRLRADVETAVASVPGLKAQAESMAGGVGAYTEMMLEPLEGFARRMEAIGIPRTETLSRVRMNLDALVKDWEARERKAAKNDAGRSPLIQQIWGRLDGKLLGIDYPGAYKELSRKYGPKLFGKGGFAPDILADELVRAGLLPEGSGANELIERLQNGEPEWFQSLDKQDANTLIETSSTKPSILYQSKDTDINYPDNGRAVGEVTPEVAATLNLNKPGTIVLDDAGVYHLLERHGKQIKNAGFKTVEDFVSYVLENFDAVFSGTKPNSYALVCRTESPYKKVTIKLTFENIGEYYRVTNGQLIRSDAYQKQTPLWEAAQTIRSTNGTPSAISGQSGVDQNITSSNAQDKPLFHVKGAASTARGSVLPTSEGYLISLFQRANLSTLPHEFGHIFRMEMQRAVDMGIEDKAMIQDQQTFEKWLSRFDDNAILETEYNERLKNNPAFKDRAFSSLSPEEMTQVRETARHEYFARGFEAYLREGKAPTKGLEGAFQRFRNWLVSIYRSALKLGVELNDDVREAFDRMIATERDMELTARRNELLSLDEKQLDTLGLSGVEREDAAGLMKKAVQIATRERIRDQRQNRRAKWREYERQAREELLKEPVYKALEGALNRPMDFDAVREAVGEKDADALLERHAGIMDENAIGDPESLAFRSNAVIVRGNELGVPEGADIKEYQKAAREIYRELQKTPAHREDLGEIRLSGDGFREMKQSGADKRKWQLVPKLKEIIEGAEYIKRNNLSKPRKDRIAAFHWLEANIELNGEKLRVGINIAEDFNGNKFYNLNHDLEDFKARKQKAPGESQNHKSGGQELLQDDTTPFPRDINSDSDNVNLYILSEQDPELLAHEHGYKRAAAMLSDMLNAEPLDKAIRKRARTIANQAEAKLFKPEDYLVTSEAIQKQANLIAARLSEKAGEQKIVDQVFETVAERELAAMPMSRAVNSGRFLADVRRAMAAQRSALRSGNIKAAMDANNKVRLNLEFARQSQYARKLQESTQSDISRFLKNKSASADAKFLVMNIAMNHGLGRYNEALARGRDDHSIAEWFKDMEDSGYTFYFEPWPLLADARSWRDMTFEEFTDLNNVVKQIATAERNKRKLLGRANKQSVAEIANELTTQARREYKTRPKKLVEKERLDTPKKWLSTLHAQLMKVEFVCNMLDGGEHGGIWERTIFRPIADAEIKRDMRLKKEVERMRSHELFGRYDTNALRQKVLVQTVNEAFTLEQRLMVALNMGNEGNYDRLKNGFGWSDEQIMDIVDSLSKEDWDFVSNVWKFLESFREESFAVEKALTGIEPKTVKATPFMTKYGEVPGGYFPVAYDPEKGQKAFERAQKTDDKKLLGGRNYGSAQTAHGHLKARSQGGTGEPLDLSFSVIGKHVFDTVHDFTFRIPVMDVAKVLRNKEVQTALNETVGTEIARLFMPWLQDVSMMRRDPSSLWEKSLSKARSLTTVYGLGYKLTVLVQQGTGYLQTIDTIGLGNTARGVAKVFENANRLKEFFNETCELSPFMALRMESFDRDIKDIDRRIIPQKGAAHAADVARDWSMKAIGLCQMGVDLGTWWGAYEKRMRETKGDMRESVAYADSVVRMTQGGGGTKDLARIQRGNEALKLFTMFYSFFNVQYNMWARRAHLTKSARDVPKAMNTVFLTAILGPVLSEILAGRGPDDDDDESWLGWGAKLTLAYPFMTIPGVRDMVNGISGDYGYQMSPVEQTFKRVVRLYNAVYDASLEDGEWSRVGREAVEIGGILSNGLITQQMVTTGLGLVRFLEGDDFELADLVRRRKRGQ